MPGEDGNGHFGITPPISVCRSTVREEEITVALLEELRCQGVFESEEGSQLREIVLSRVGYIVKKFVREVVHQGEPSDSAADTTGGKIFTFGSYSMGVHGPGSDIDALCVVPMQVSREDFFGVFAPMLKELEGVTEVLSKFLGIDLLMARLALPSIPDDLTLENDNILLGIDNRCMRGLGGPRLASAILRLVPNVQVFRDSLRCIRFWAQQRAIYSSAKGFLGGAAWAVLVARVCQLYPNAATSTIISRFFIIMYQWSWPHPVLLKQIEEGLLQCRLWDPKLYLADRAHRMPIITPAYPAECLTFNVRKSTETIITEEFTKGADTVDKIVTGTATWSDLFAKHDFFHKYRYYLQVIASASEPDIQIKWAGAVESRILQFVTKLEYIDPLALVHPFTKCFHQVVYCLNDEEAIRVAQGKISDPIAARQKIDISGEEGASAVYLTIFYIGLAIKPKPPGSVGPQRLDISHETTQFIASVKTWEQFDESRMGLLVRHIKRSSLPDSVFDPGERPAKSARKRMEAVSK